jgi:hypothetical protein
MVAISSSSNETRPVGDPTSFILTAQAGIKICDLISFIAAVALLNEAYKDPSFINPWSERCAQITWFSPDHLLCASLGLPLMISGVLRDMVANEKKKNTIQ